MSRMGQDLGVKSNLKTGMKLKARKNAKSYRHTGLTEAEWFWVEQLILESSISNRL